VADSPFTVDIIDNRSVTASGDGLTQAAVNQMTTFTVNTGQDNVGNANSLQAILRCTFAAIFVRFISFHLFIHQSTSRWYNKNIAKNG